MVAVAGKNGYLYGLSRGLKEVYFKVPVTAIANEGAPLTAAGTRFLPGTQGGVEWNGPAYSPVLNALFVNAVEWATIIKVAPAESLKYTPGKLFVGSANGFGDSDKERSGWLTAVDAETGRTLWKYHASEPLLAAVTPTAGGLLLTGDLEGHFLAFDAAKGEIVFQKDVGGPVGGGVITYGIEGKQYIAIAAGMNNPIMKTKSGRASVEIVALP